MFDCDHEKLLDEYYGMKTVGLGKDMKPSKDKVILYDSRIPEEAIQLNLYLDWLKDNYQLNIKSNFTAGTP